MERKAISLAVTKRQCGECTACCSVPEVPELSKPPWVPCTHLCGQGCGIYPTRPYTCQSYECQWLQGELGEDHRPDRLGLIVDMINDTDGKLCVRVREVEAGAWGRPGAAWQIQKLQKKMKAAFVLLLPYGTKIRHSGSRMAFVTADPPQMWLRIANPDLE
jgi:hypothetical protein